MRSSPARHAFAALGPLLLAAAVLSASGQQSPRELYELARLLDESGQNLAEVIRLYGQVADLAKDQPALAARALVPGGVGVDSPEGRRVVFPGITKGVRGVNLWTMPEGGGQPTQLTDTPASALGATQGRK